MKKVEPGEYSPGQRADRRALAEITDLIDDGAYDAASVVAWEVQRSTPGDPEIWLLLTRIDYLRERYAAAMYAARMATRLDPVSPQAWLWLARTGATRARWRTEGLDAALQATALAPDDPQTWTALAELHLASDARYEAAIAAERAVRVGPEDVDAHRMLGAIAVRAEEWRHAVAAFRQVLRIAPDDDVARAGLVQALEALNIDPSSELRSHGFAPRRQSGVSRRIRRLAQESQDLATTGWVRTRRRGLLIGVAISVAAGALFGLAVPNLGLTRGLAAAGALVLMWVAIWPLRRQPRSAEVAAGSAAADGGGVRPARPAPSATPNPSTQPEPTSALARSATRSEEPVRSAAREPARTANASPSRSLADQSPPPPAAATAVDADPSPAAGEPLGGDHRANAWSRAATREASSKRPRRLPRPPQDSLDEPNGLPDDPAELVALSQARLAESDLEAARAAATRLAHLAPDSLEANRALAAVALAAQDYPQAEWHYGKVLEIEPLDQEAHERLAMAKEGRRREAQQQRQRRRKG